MTSSTRQRALWIIAAVVCGVVGYVFLLSFNGVGVVFFAAALVCLVIAFREFLVTTVAVLTVAICSFGTWATLGGGANPLTCIPWIIIGLFALWVVVYDARRRAAAIRELPVKS